MRNTLLLSTLIFLTACGAQSSALQSSDIPKVEAPGSLGYRALAEYEKMDSIILSFPLIDDAKGTEFRSEYSNMMKSFLDQSDARLSFYMIYRQGSAEKFYDMFPEMMSYASRIDIRPVYDEILNFKFEESNDDDFGTWMRDASPVSGIDIATGKPVLFPQGYYTDLARFQLQI